MKAASIISLGAFAAGVLGQTGDAVFEDPDFNVTEALIDIGFNVSAIPELADLVERSSLAACSIAVSLICSQAPCAGLLEEYRNLTIDIVYFVEHRLRKHKSTFGEFGILQCIHRCVLVGTTSSSQPSLCLQALNGFGRLGVGAGVTSHPMPLRREVWWSHLVRWRLKYRRGHHGVYGEIERDHGLL